MVYNHNLIEKKWQQYWGKNQTYKFVDDFTNPKKFYCLDMFPYPSGAGLHVGHLKGYLATEILARYKKMTNHNVLHPIGWDAFGLPAEQYALKTGNHPELFTQQNINNFRAQLQKIGFSFDYNKEVNTTDPNYYATTQWIFSQLVQHNLAEIQEIDVNWCPELKSVLANEEVIIKNNQRVSERGEHPVIYKPMKQWVLKITKYADRLLDDLDSLNWPEGIKEHQRAWIGRTQKYVFQGFFANKLFDLHLTYASNFKHLQGILVNEQHWITQHLCTNETFKAEIEQYFQSNEQGVRILSTYVYFSWNNHKYPIVLSKHLTEKTPTAIPWFASKESDLVDNEVEAAFLKIHLKKSCRQVTTYKLRDWVFSRQRYWGEPIPVYFDAQKQVHLETKLPLILPTLEKVEPSSDGQSPLVHATDWLVFYHQSEKFVRETNTMPNWAGSCWYYLGYIMKNHDQSYELLTAPTTQDRLMKWLPVDMYIGGQEHAVLHLLYARFWHKFLYDLKLVPTKEPFLTLLNQGMILGPDGQKMSKSKGNVINPDEIVESHGADALRLYECFMGPVVSSLPWNEKNLNAVRKWVDRVYRTFINLNQFGEVSATDLSMRKLEASLVDNFEKSLAKFSLNVGVSEMMIFINKLHAFKKYSFPALQTFVKIFSFYAPHLAEELWSTILKQPSSIYHAKWPQIDLSVLNETNYELPVTINNKLRIVLNFSKNSDHDTIQAVVLAHPVIQVALNQKTIVKIVHVNQKIFNIIIK